MVHFAWHSRYLMVVAIVALCLQTGNAQSSGFFESDTTSFYESDGFWRGLLSEVRHGFGVPESLDRSQPEDPVRRRDPVKCLTPHLAWALSHDNPEAESILGYFESFDSAEISNDEVYISPSGRFALHFSRTGAHAVPAADTNSSGIPDYIERAAGFADESYEIMVIQQGFHDFLPLMQPYEIRFRETNAYGFTQTTGLNSTFIVVHRNFVGFPANDDPEGDQIGALKVTIAHEMKHASQYAATRWQGQTSGPLWSEMDATMMEDVVYDEVNDYHNYLNSCIGPCSIFRNPGTSTPGSYTHVTWKLYYYERYGIDFWVQVWDELSLSPLTQTFFGIMRNLLQNRGTSFDVEFTRNHLWHAEAGSGSNPAYGFREAVFYPRAARTQIVAVPDSIYTLSSPIAARAARYLTLSPETFLSGDIEVEVRTLNVGIGAGLLVQRPNGEILEFIQTRESGSGAASIWITTPVSWSEAASVTLVLTNTNNSAVSPAFVVYGFELPEFVTLEPNYPNPFNSGTTIPFSIPEESLVRLQVFDIQGRLVATLADGVLPAGRYFNRFSSEGLASGVYIYQLVANNESRSGKLLIVK